jgi:hypothetical protein
MALVLVPRLMGVSTESEKQALRFQKLGYNVLVADIFGADQRGFLPVKIRIGSTSTANPTSPVEGREPSDRHPILENPAVIRPSDSATLKFSYSALRGDSKLGLFASTDFDPSRYGCGPQIVLEDRSVSCEIPVQHLGPFVLLDLHYTLHYASSASEYSVSISDNGHTSPR